MTDAALPGPSPSPAVLDSLLKALNAYDRLYGLPVDLDQQRGLLGTLLRLDQQDRPEAAIDPLVDQALAGLSREAIRAAIVDRASSALAKRAHQWQQALLNRAEGVLAAYLQDYGPELSPDLLTPLATAVVPLLEGDRPTTRAEALGLISQLVQAMREGGWLDGDRSAGALGAIAAALTPENLALAQRLATSFSQRSMADAVAATVTAYVAQYAPTLGTVGADLIAQALRAVVKNQVDFGLDLDLDMVDGNLLIQQVSFQLNILQQSPPASKTAEAIAAEVDAAVRALQSHPDRPKPVDVTTGIPRPDGVSSSWTSTRPPQTTDNDDFWSSRQS